MTCEILLSSTSAKRVCTHSKKWATPPGDAKASKSSSRVRAPPPSTSGGAVRAPGDRQGMVVHRQASLE